MPKTVLFCMHQETGHINPTFKLAKTLARRGYCVSYFAIVDLVDQIQAQGFNTVSWFPDLYPKNCTNAEAKLEALPYVAGSPSDITESRSGFSATIKCAQKSLTPM